MSALAVPVLEPEFFVFLDWETYYDADYTLKKLSTSDYVLDPRFEAIGVAVNDGDETVWMEAWEFREWAKSVPWERTAVIAHHAHFDHLILSHHFDVHPAFNGCTMSMARTFGIDGGVSLESLAQHFGVGTKGTEVENVKGMHRADFSPEAWLRYGDYSKTDTDLCKAIFDAMMAQGFPEVELWLIDQTIRMFTEPKLYLDEPLLEKYLLEERARKTELLARIGMDKQAIGSNATLAKAFLDLGVEAPMKTSPKTGKQIYAFAKNDPGMQALLEHEEDDVRWLAEARISVKSTINETRTERFLKMGKGGAPMRAYLNYFKAHTGRWAGGDKRNFQNLGRVNKKKPNSGMLKKALVAPPGWKVIAADSGAIEARKTAWLAGHTSLIEGFRENRDVYLDFASVIFDREVNHETNPEDEVPRQLSKVCILGLGYQMSWPKLALTLLAGAMGNPPLQLTEEFAAAMGVDVAKFAREEWKMKKVEGIVSRLPLDQLVVHCAVTDRLVQTYREANEPIVNLWEEMEQVIDTMAESEPGEETTFGPNDCLTVLRHMIRLPNGLYLRYPGLRHSEEDGLGGHGSGYSYLGQYGKQRQRLYGGALTENVVQALARIVVAEQMLSVKAKYGYDAVLMTHDEVVLVEPDSEAEIAKYRLIQEMTIAPAWAVGLPLKASGGYGQSLGSAK